MYVKRRYFGDLLKTIVLIMAGANRSVSHDCEIFRTAASWHEPLRTLVSNRQVIALPHIRRLSLWLKLAKGAGSDPVANHRRRQLDPLGSAWTVATSA